MTLRLSKEDERLLALLAQEDGVSRQEATIRAIHELSLIHISEPTRPY